MATDSYTVLVVEDDDDCREATTAFVKHLGWGVEEAISGISALDKLEVGRTDLMQKIDIILTDNMMPGLSGIPFVRKVRERRFKQPLIFCSSIFPENIDSLRDELNISVLLKKPYSLKELEEALRKASALLP